MRPVSGARASMAERTSAPPGADSAVATGASGDVAAQPQRAALRRRPGASSGSTSPIGGAAPRGGRRRESPAARRAATIAPAEVPTKASTSRRSAPASSSMPASRPVIHASPITPPPARTRTSGATKPGIRVTLDAGRLDAPAPAPALAWLYAIAYVCIVAVALLEEITAIHIGPRVRALREAMDLSLRDLALRSGVSAPMLSQVERGETSPTLQIASRIAAGLELRLSQLLRLDEAGTVNIVRAGERRSGGSRAAGHRVEVLTAPLPGLRAELSRHVLAPGAQTGGPGDPPMHEAGSREIAVVQDGTVVLDIDGERHELSTGDCVTFDADLPHHFENPGPGEAALLAVVSAGLRRS